MSSVKQQVQQMLRAIGVGDPFDTAVPYLGEQGSLLQLEMENHCVQQSFWFTITI